LKIGFAKPALHIGLNIFGREFSVDFPTREDWSTECVDLIAPYGLVFFTDGSLCDDRACACVFSDILNVRESHALGSHATVFKSEVYAILTCSEYCISEGIGNRAVSICSASRAALLALKSYGVSSRVVLQCRDSLQELVQSRPDYGYIDPMRYACPAIGCNEKIQLILKLAKKFDVVTATYPNLNFIISNCAV
jgi:hypothetical protein